MDLPTHWLTWIGNIAYECLGGIGEYNIQVPVVPGVEVHVLGSISNLVEHIQVERLPCPDSVENNTLSSSSSDSSGHIVMRVSISDEDSDFSAPLSCTKLPIGLEPLCDIVDSSSDLCPVGLPQNTLYRCHQPVLVSGIFIQSNILVLQNVRSEYDDAHTNIILPKLHPVHNVCHPVQDVVEELPLTITLGSIDGKHEVNSVVAIATIGCGGDIQSSEQDVIY